MQALAGRIGFAGGRRALVIGALAVYTLASAAVFVHSFRSSASPTMGVALAVAMVLAPVLFVVALRMPLVFPFGLYVALIPFDEVLLFSRGDSIPRLAAIVAAGGLLLNILLRKRLCAPPQAWYTWGLFVGWATLSFFWSINVDATKSEFQTVLQLFLMMTVLAIYPAREREFKWMLAIVVLSGVATAVYTFFEATHGVRFSDTARVSIQSQSGAYVDPNFLSTSYLLAIAVATCALNSVRSLAIRSGCIASIVVMCFGVFVTGSRGGFLALVAAMLWIIWKSRYRFQLFVFSGLALSASLFVPTVWARFAKDPSQQWSGSGRTDIWATGLASVKSHLLLGSGFGSFPDVYNRGLYAVYQSVFQGIGRPSHSIVVGTLVEVGLIGLLLVLAAWFMSFRQLRMIARSSSLHPMRVAFEATIIGLFFQSLFLDVYSIKYYWLAHSLVLTLANLAAQQRAADVPQPARAASGARAFGQATAGGT
ncbi:MAG: O-antigen ligase family protein [Vulcanimicrobiaceae bacterium]